MLEKLPNTGVEKNMRNDLVWSFIKDELDVRKSEGVFQSQLVEEVDLESMLLTCPVLCLQHAVPLHFWGATGTCTEKLSGLVSIDGIPLTGRGKNQGCLLKQVYYFFFFIQWLLPEAMSKILYIQVPRAPLLPFTVKKCALLSSEEANGNSEFLLGKIPLELKKEFKGGNILGREANADPIGLRKCFQVSFHSPARKDRFA